MDFAALYEQEQPRIFAYLLSRTGNWHVAEDLTSATFVRALELGAHTNPHALLLTVARYCWLNYWQTERRRSTFVFSDVFTRMDEDQYAVLAEDGRIDAVIDACDTAMAAAMMRALLSQCTDLELRMIELRYVRNLPAQDAAAQLGLDKQAYNKRHNRLMHHMGAALGRPKRERQGCAVAGCSFAVSGRGLCNAHYLQWRGGADLPAAPPKAARERPERCDECSTAHYSRGKCRQHYEAMRRIERMQERRVMVTSVRDGT